MSNFFKVKEHGSTVRTEIMAGVTTFMAMAYILMVNAGMFSALGTVSYGAIYIATAISAVIGTVLIGLLSNLPLAQASGMGLNAFFVYTVCFTFGLSYANALVLVLVDGIVFVLLTVTGLRKMIFDAIPAAVKNAISAGIGLFIAFIGLQNAKLTVNSDSTLVTIFSMSGSLKNGTFRSQGITALLALIGVLVIGVLMVKKVKGNILLGIFITWGLGILCQFAGLYVPDPANGFYSLLPDFSSGFGIPSLAPTFLKMDFSKVFSGEFLVVIFAFLFVDMFDTLGTLIGVASKADMLDKEGKLPRISGALLADAVGTSVGAALGVSTTTTFVESASGVTEGGRTGLTSVTSALLFGLSLFLSPIFLAIPSFATAPALIVVGFLMISSVLKVDFSDLCQGIPAFITLIAMPFMYSISEGIALGTISFVVINVLAGPEKRKAISPVMYVLAILFAAKYFVI